MKISKDFDFFFILFCTLWAFFLLQKVAHPAEYIFVPVWVLMGVIWLSD